MFAPVLRSSRRRAVWLGVNLITAFLAAWVIGLFEGTLDKVVALAVLMPIVAAILLNMLCAALARVVIPILLRASGVDPALAGGVILTTVTDVVGFLAFLGLATMVLL